MQEGTGETAVSPGSCHHQIVYFPATWDTAGLELEISLQWGCEVYSTVLPHTRAVCTSRSHFPSHFTSWHPLLNYDKFSTCPALRTDVVAYIESPRAAHLPSLTAIWFADSRWLSRHLNEIGPYTFLFYSTTASLMMICFPSPTFSLPPPTSLTDTHPGMICAFSPFLLSPFC